MAEPLRFPLLVWPSNRDETTNRDARLVNGFIEVVGDSDAFVYKRPGLGVYTSAGAAIGRGLFNWKGDIYSIWGATLYKNNSPVAGSVDTTNGVYTWTSCLGATPKLFFQNGVKAYTYDSGAGLVQVTDGDYPSSTVKGAAFLDGFVYVMTPTAFIQGSGINDPQNWDPLNSIFAYIEPDQGVALAKQLVYVVAFKQWSVEIFYDAGNPTGSPLGPVQGAKVSIGCRHADSVREIEGDLLWISQTREGGISVSMMSNLKAHIVSTPAIERLLQQAGFTTVMAWTAKITGHKFYGLTLPSSNLTLVYDITMQRWAQWTDTNGAYFPVCASTFTNAQQTLLQHATNGKVCSLETTNYTDDGEVIVFDLYTPNFDGGTRRKKYLHSMDLVADQNTGSILFVRNSDDDYQSWTNFRSVDLGASRPRLVWCGTFRRRAYHFRHFAPTPLRMQAAEIQLEVGTL